VSISENQRLGNDEPGDDIADARTGHAKTGSVYPKRKGSGGGRRGMQRPALEKWSVILSL
jgi:hypothetical protein|tara:strand:- start:367 stop:546 length:180 start_codon:yes stop_codon:yes gene_type:complete